MSKVEITKEQIKEAAKALFQHYGFEKTSMDEIAKACHKAKGSIYYHFESKEDLYASIINDEIAQLKLKLLEILNNDSLIAPMKFAHYISAKIKFINQSDTYRYAIKLNFLYQSGITHFNKLTQEIMVNFEKWEKEQLITLIINGKNKLQIYENIDATAFIDIVFMILNSLEIQFYVKNNYEYYSNAFNFLVMNAAQALDAGSFFTI